MDIRLLEPKDRAALDSFLQADRPQTMFLRSNLAHSGIADDGRPYQGRYVACFENGQITGVAAHYWNGMLVLLAPRHTAELALAATSGRKLGGIIGPWQQALDAQEALGIDDTLRFLRSKETLMTLTLDRLRIPPPMLQGQQLQCRLATADDIPLLTGWRHDFRCEALGATPSHTVTRQCEEEVTLWVQEKSQFVLMDGGHPVAGCCFNARLPDAVQIGNVWTPPDLRSRGYARAVVAGALAHARDAGADLGVLFTPADHAAAQTAYLALGFSAIGDYAILLYRT